MIKLGIALFWSLTKNKKTAQMENILYYFDKIQDNRQKQGKRYKLKSILALVLIGYMQGYTSLARIYRFGKTLTKTQKKTTRFYLWKHS